MASISQTTDNTCSDVLDGPDSDFATVPLRYQMAYHGGTEAVPAPEIRERIHAPDFGLGFYTTSSEEQASRWARRVRLVRTACEAVVTRYDISALGSSGLKIKEFGGVSEEWFDTVIACRGGNDILAGFDIVVGPVANDNVYQTLRLFETGIYSKKEAMRRLLAERLFDQIVFKTPASLRCIRYVSHATVVEAGGNP